MTTIGSIKKKCAICGKISKHSEILSTNVLGSPDLDTRPPNMERSTIFTWVQRCPWCGYCASDISKRIREAENIIHSVSYKQQLNNSAFPELANSFLCFSLILENVGNYAGAGWECIHAAWSCDDANLNTCAQSCRKKAVILLQKAREKGQSFAKRTGAEETIMADLLRRSGQFELALKVCNDGLKKNPEKIISDILRFQKILIGKSDVACHTIAEANDI